MLHPCCTRTARRTTNTSDHQLLAAASALEPRLPAMGRPKLLATVGLEVEGEEDSKEDATNTGVKDIAAASAAAAAAAAGDGDGEGET